MPVFFVEKYGSKSLVFSRSEIPDPVSATSSLTRFSMVSWVSVIVMSPFWPTCMIEAIALFNGDRIEMALTPIQAGMLLLTFLTVMNNLHDGETNAIEGVSHFALFAAFIALVMMGLI